jgi:hypothetical protein
VDNLLFGIGNSRFPSPLDLAFVDHHLLLLEFVSFLSFLSLENSYLKSLIARSICFFLLLLHVPFSVTFFFKDFT